MLCRADPTLHPTPALEPPEAAPAADHDHASANGLARLQLQPASDEFILKFPPPSRRNPDHRAIVSDLDDVRFCSMLMKPPRGVEQEMHLAVEVGLVGVRDVTSARIDFIIPAGV